MSKHPETNTTAHPHDRCINPDMRELLPEYMVELLTDAAAEEVEEHLLFCRYCREDYLKILGMRGRARHARLTHGDREAAISYTEQSLESDPEK